MDRAAVNQLACPVVSDASPLNLAATVGKRFTDRLERLREPRDLARWLVAAGLWEREHPVSASDLAAARELREALFRCVRSAVEGSRLPRRDVGAINAWAARPTRSPRLVPGGGLIWPPAGVQEALADIARDAVLILGGEPLRRVRRCAAPACSIYFLDRSRTGRRRWCSMATCGNRAKVTRFRRRSN